MPDTLTAFDPAPIQSDTCTASLVTTAYMRGLWAAYQAARDGYSEEDEERTGAAFSEAQTRLLTARTIDPEGVALKLNVLAERPDMVSRALAEIAEDLRRPQPLPSLVSFCRAISVAAAPHTEQGGGIKSKTDLVDALVPLIGHYTVADAVCAIAMLHTAYTALGGDEGDDPMFATMMLLEDFACGADAADADSAAARAQLIEKSQSTDGWDLGHENMAAATRQARHDLRAMRKGRFDANVFGGTFEAYFTNPVRRSEAGNGLPIAAE